MDSVVISMLLTLIAGLFIPEELAWDGIEKFLTGGALSDKIQWISPDELPEDGNYINISKAVCQSRQTAFHAK